MNDSRSEVDVTKLMASVRKSVLERKANEPRSSFEGNASQEIVEPPPLEPGPSLHLSQPRPNSQRFEELITRAREKTEVSSFIPKLFRRLFRKQGGFNRATLEVATFLMKENRQIHKNLSEIAAYLQAENGWLSALASTHAADRRWQVSSMNSLVELKKEARTLASAVEDMQSQLASGTQSQESLQQQLLAQRSASDTLGRSTQALEDGLKAEIAARETAEARLETYGQTASWLRDALSAEVQAREGLLASWTESHGWFRDALSAEVQAREALLASWTESHAWSRDALSAEAKAREQVEQAFATSKARMDDLHRAVRVIEERHVTDTGLIKGELHLLARNLASFVETLAKPRGARKPKQPASETVPDKHALDAFYLAFENKFRGDRQLIKDRVRIYLPEIAKTDAGRAKSPILDLGCGRGEWLELLSEEGLTAAGVDANIFMKAECLERGLNVTEQDALAYLRSQKSASLGAVTGFHIIEHLEFPILLELVREVFRVLRRKGLVIFETPNPENVLVGSNRFYSDPTHLRPVPKEFASFIMSAAGFKDVQIRTLHPDETNLTSAQAPQLQQFLNQMFFGDQDYAVIARK